MDKDLIGDVIDAYYEAVKDRSDADARVKDLESQILEHMRETQRKSMSTRRGGKVLKLTYVQSSTNSIDEAGLKKSLPAKLWVKITKLVLDKAKLEAAMEIGEIDPIIVGQHVTVKQSRPYIRFTESSEKEGETTDGTTS
jgi:hypothetical protein